MKNTLLTVLMMLGASVLTQDIKKTDAPAAEKENLVFDGGFDVIKKQTNSNSHWGYYKNGVFYGWSTSADNKKEIAWTEQDSEIFVSPPCCMKLVIKQPKNPITFTQSLHYYGIKLKPGTKYRISCMIKLQDVTANGVCMNLWDGNNIWFPWMTGTSDWKKVESIYTAPKDADNAKQLNLNFRFYGTGTVWIDNVIMEEL